MVLPMPGSSSYIVLPESMGAVVAMRILSWLKRAVSPAADFARGSEEVDEAK